MTPTHIETRKHVGDWRFSICLEYVKSPVWLGGCITLAKRTLRILKPFGSYTAPYDPQTTSFKTKGPCSRATEIWRGLQGALCCVPCLDILISRSCLRRADPDVQERWVVNLSRTHLCDSELDVLWKGLNFAPTPSCILVSQVFASMERGLSKVPEEEVTIAHKCICGVLSQVRLPPSNLPPPLRNALNPLKKRDIFILPADKGRATVVLERTQYDARCWRC